eukprot:gene25068-31480_t
MSCDLAYHQSMECTNRVMSCPFYPINGCHNMCSGFVLCKDLVSHMDSLARSGVLVRQSASVTKETRDASTVTDIVPIHVLVYHAKDNTGSVENSPVVCTQFSTPVKSARSPATSVSTPTSSTVAATSMTAGSVSVSPSDFADTALHVDALPPTPRDSPAPRSAQSSPVAVQPVVASDAAAVGRAFKTVFKPPLPVVRIKQPASPISPLPATNQGATYNVVTSTLQSVENAKILRARQKELPWLSEKCTQDLIWSLVNDLQFGMKEVLNQLGVTKSDTVLNFITTSRYSHYKITSPASALDALSLASKRQIASVVDEVVKKGMAGTSSRVEIEAHLNSLDAGELKKVFDECGVTLQIGSKHHVMRANANADYSRDEVLDAIVFDLCRTVDEGRETLHCAFAPYSSNKLKAVKGKTMREVYLKLGRNALLTLATSFSKLSGVNFDEMSTFDKKWESDRGFVFYDFRDPTTVPQNLLGTFDVLVVDPPFIVREVWEKYAVTSKLLLKQGNDTDGNPAGKVILTTVIENSPFLFELLGAKPTKYQPSIPNLVYQYNLFTNYSSPVFDKLNPEIPE